MTKENSAMTLAKRTNYLNKDIQYLKNVNISEWDIHSAGLSVLKFRKLLPDKTLDEWEKMDKHTRTVKEGLLQKNNPEISNIILDTLSNARQAFVYLNGIKSEQILSIKKDALFLINKVPNISTIKTFEFRKKHTYTSYLYINGKEFYYSSLTEGLDVKGLSEEAKDLQKNYFLKDISRILRMSEQVSQESLFAYLKKYRRQYLNRELNIETYRNLNDNGLYRINNYTLRNISQDMLPYVDISQNYIDFILPLINALL